MMRFVIACWAALSVAAWGTVWSWHPLGWLAAGLAVGGLGLALYVMLGLSWMGSEAVADGLPWLPRWVARAIGMVLLLALISLALSFNPLEP